MDRGSTWGTHPKTGDEVERKPDEAQPFAGLAFKIATDPFVGKLVIPRSTLVNYKLAVHLKSSTGEKERVGVSFACKPTSAKMFLKSEPVTLPPSLASKVTTTGHTRVTRTIQLSWKASLSRNRQCLSLLSRNQGRPREDEHCYAALGRRRPDFRINGKTKRTAPSSAVWASVHRKSLLTV